MSFISDAMANELATNKTLNIEQFLEETAYKSGLLFLKIKVRIDKMDPSAEEVPPLIQKKPPFSEAEKAEIINWFGLNISSYEKSIKNDVETVSAFDNLSETLDLDIELLSDVLKSLNLIPESSEYLDQVIVKTDLFISRLKSSKPSANETKLEMQRLIKDKEAILSTLQVKLSKFKQTHPNKKD